MAYPLPLFYQEEDAAARDLEYLQQMYPAEAKRYQKIIADVLNKIDYEGSVIYDEYPDKWQLYRLTKIIMDKIRYMENAGGTGAADAGNAASGTQEVSGIGDETQQEHIEEFVQVLLYYEIYKKRHANNRGILKF